MSVVVWLAEQKEKPYKCSVSSDVTMVRSFSTDIEGRLEGELTFVRKSGVWSSRLKERLLIGRLSRLSCLIKRYS